MPDYYSSFFDYWDNLIFDNQSFKKFLDQKISQDSQFAQKLFDAISPIAIYHFADLCYAKEATQGLKKARNLIGDDYFADFLICEDKKQDKRSWTKDNLQNGPLKSWYNVLFAYNVENLEPGVLFEIDSYGGFNYLLDGETLFGSDDSHNFPWYTDINSIKDRLALESRPSF